MSPSDTDATGWRGTNEGSKLAGDTTRWSNGWLKYNAAFGQSGFTALPAGDRSSFDGIFDGLTHFAYFWSSSTWTRILSCSGSEVIRLGSSMQKGHSVRLVKNQDSAPTLTISPPDTTVSTGDAVQFTCTIYLSEGGTIDATIAANWSLSPGKAGMINQTGHFIAGGNSGIETVTATYKGYSVTVSVTVQSTLETGTMTGTDGTVYQTVKIGDQWWTAENLKETQYCNGDPILEETDDSTWAGLLTGARCAYDNDMHNESDTYGYLYNWYAVIDSRSIAPPGWHVPTDEDWKKMTMTLGMSRSDADNLSYRGNNEGSQLAGDAQKWVDGILDNNDAFGQSGFAALPGGYRSNISGHFDNLCVRTSFWASEEESANYAWSRYLYFDYSRVGRFSSHKNFGFSVRLVKD
ncbi:hypothetical protein JW948_08275 [bacterium]|nr:hypothetical protein [bacterium]